MRVRFRFRVRVRFRVRFGFGFRFSAEKKIVRIVPTNASRFERKRLPISCCAKLVLALALRVPANIVVLLMFLIFQILFLIHLVSVIFKCVDRHVRLSKLG